jgi:peptidoglycan hydrolase-like protein with peptidoglycan-binding domain
MILVGETGPESISKEMIDRMQRSTFTEALHPRAAGKFATAPGAKAAPAAKKAPAAPARPVRAKRAPSAHGGGGNLSFDGKRGAGYGTPGGDKRVHALQDALNRLGLTDAAGKKLKLDGKLGPKTTAAIKKAQRKLGLKANGVVTPKLLAQLSKAKSLGKPAAKKAVAKKVAPAKAAAPIKKAPPKAPPKSGFASAGRS